MSIAFRNAYYDVIDRGNSVQWRHRTVPDNTKTLAELNLLVCLQAQCLPLEESLLLWKGIIMLLCDHGVGENWGFGEEVKATPAHLFVYICNAFCCLVLTLSGASHFVLPWCDRQYFYWWSTANNIAGGRSRSGRVHQPVCVCRAYMCALTTTVTVSRWF